MSWKLSRLVEVIFVNSKIIRGIGKTLSHQPHALLRTLITTKLSQKIDVLFEKPLYSNLK
jgi:hypothetical protein